ncbi:hypothetical protein [Cupriavidus pinatubonensis]|uniref:Uncharacterized protein n=1 Tax=Cupriavidus pinatubonensis TaxID=248026 RepID=A0ABN7YBE8_9BURK|nr:hypothetical protein [Cupriavidus pinatubonensis]CAG9169751.1 hypothetical protein LMG23994_01645 [Cupriavidus pinatubonensis]
MECEEGMAVVARIDRIVARLKTAGDTVLLDLDARDAELSEEQRDAANFTLGAVIEHTDSLLLMRASVENSVLCGDDADLAALMQCGGAVADEILLAATQP